MNNDYIIELRKKLSKADKNNDLLNLLLICERIVRFYKEKDIETGYDYAEDMYRVATIFLNTGRIDKATKVFEKADKIAATLANADNLRGDILNNLAICYVNKNELSTAYSTFKEALNLKKLIYGENSNEYINLLCNIGSVLFDKGDYDKAIYYHYEALNKRKNKDVSFADNLNFLGYDFEARGEIANAINYFNQALNIIKAVSGANSNDYIANTYYLAGVYEKNEQYDKALKYYDIVLTKIKENEKEAHPYHAEVLGKMANVCVKLENYQRALMFSIKAMAIVKKAMGENHIYYANSVKNVADIHFKTKDYKRAIELYEDEVRLKGQILGETNEVTITALIHLADVYIKNGDIERAKELCQNILGNIDSTNPAYYSVLLALVRVYTYSKDLELLYTVYEAAKEVKANLGFDDMLQEAFKADTAENKFEARAENKENKEDKKENLEDNKAIKKSEEKNADNFDELEQMSFDFSLNSAEDNEDYIDGSRADEFIKKENDKEAKKKKSDKNRLNKNESYEQENFDSFFKNDDNEQA